MNDGTAAFDRLVTGVVVIGLITALGLRAAKLAPLATQIGNAGSGLMNTVQKG